MIWTLRTAAIPLSGTIPRRCPATSPTIASNTAAATTPTAMELTGYAGLNTNRKEKVLTEQGPNDETANEQQDVAHHMYYLTLDGKLHLAPLKNPQEILDVGTGTGIWAM